MSVSIRKKNKKLYLDIYENGTRKWEALHLSLTDDKDINKETMRLAEACRAKRALQIVSGEWGFIDPVAAKTSLYSFIEKMAKTGKHSGRVRCVLIHIKEYPGGRSIQIGQVDKKWIEGFQDFLLGRIARNTARSYSIAVRQALRKAVKDGIIMKNPGLEVDGIKRQETDMVFLNIEEIQKLADIEPRTDTEKQIRRAFLFACYTGLRVSDLMTITWGDIEHVPLQIIKRQKKTKVKVFVPLSNLAWAIINDGTIHNHTSLIFPILEVIKNNRNHYLTKWANRAGINKSVGWHTARHTFAVKSLESGADIYTVSKLLGHTDISTTQIYAKATDKMKREAVNALPEINIGRA
jgi:site-specific recombinase XerD